MAKEINSIIRIALIGPESTAKTTLSENLANHYKTVLVKEYAREYLSNLHRKYNINDILTIAKEQLKHEQQLLLQANKFIFVDTELILAKVWCEDLFNTCPDWILKNILNYQYDLYLLTFPDIPWEEDPLRENPHRRELLFNWYEKELKKINANYAIIKGVGRSRLDNCISIIEEKF
ncbi:MAG: AAA family ATPase [Bacteroidota bacterium]